MTVEHFAEDIHVLAGDLGEHHDLLPMFHELNRRYFRNRVNATITYGPAPRITRPRKSIKMGSYSAESREARNRSRT